MLVFRSIESWGPFLSRLKPLSRSPFDPSPKPGGLKTSGASHLALSAKDVLFHLSLASKPAVLLGGTGPRNQSFKSSPTSPSCVVS